MERKKELRVVPPSRPSLRRDRVSCDMWPTIDRPRTNRGDWERNSPETQLMRPIKHAGLFVALHLVMPAEALFTSYITFGDRT